VLSVADSIIILAINGVKNATCLMQIFKPNISPSKGQYLSLTLP
jgi:hypothetical protein